MAITGKNGKNGMTYPYESSSPMFRLIRITQTFTMKKRKRNMMLALEATSVVGRIVATTMRINPVRRIATYGVLRAWDIRAKTGGSM